MNENLIKKISFPCFIIDIKSRKIYSANEEVNYLLLSYFNDKGITENFINELVNIIFERLGDNDAVTFSYKILSSGFSGLIKVRCQYMEEKKEYIQVILYTDMNNYISTVDLSVFAEIVPSGLMLVEITPDKKYIAKYVNTSLLNMLGYTRKECEEYFSHDILRFIHPEDIENGFRSYYEQIAATGSFSLDGRLVHKNGSSIIVSFVGKMIQDMNGNTWLYCSVTDITQNQMLLDETYEGKQIYSAIENVSRHSFFKYEIVAKKISFYGLSSKSFLSKSFTEYTVDELLEEERRHGIENSYINILFQNIEHGINEHQTIQIPNLENKPRWLSFKYDFIYDRNGKAVSAIGQIQDVTQQIQAKIYYDKAIALWSLDQNCDTQVAINLTENMVVDGRSLIIEHEKLISLTADQYFDKAFSVMIDSPEKERLMSKANRETLIAYFYNNDLRLQFELEIKLGYEHLWIRISIDLVENPMSNSIIALIKWKNINDVKLQEAINKMLIADSYDFTCCIFTKTDSYIMVQNIENTYLIPDSISGGYEKFVNSLIERYSDEDNKEYLKFCFSIKNLVVQLKQNSKYAFVGSGSYPDGSPAVKVHEFMYLDKKKGIILLSRRDITNQGERLAFKMDGTLLNFEFNEVLCVESFGRKCEITTAKGVFIANENISSLQQRLPGKIFTRCHRSYIINSMKIEKIEKNFVKLSNAKEIPANRQSLNFLRNKLQI